MRALTSLLLAAAVLAAACGTKVVNPVSGREERTVMDERTEIAEGKKAHEAVLQEYGGPLANPRLQAYVNDLGQRIARQSHRANLQWTFTVLDSADVNAFALPGGYVYITRGIMAYLDSEADLAGVLGHEIGHVTARHGAQRATRQQRAGAGVMAATVLGVLAEAVGVRGAAQAANQVSTGVAAGSIASYSREQELQADQLGAEYLARTGYNPKNMVDVIGLLRDQERFNADSARAAGRQAPSGGANWLASHPTSEQRLAAITRIAENARGQYADDARGRYLQAIDGMPFGDSREQGVVRGQQFFHEPLAIALTAPAGWSIDNDADSLSIVNPAGDAGLVMKLVPPEAGRTHDEILRNGFKANQGRSERLALNGLDATYFVGSRAGANNQAQSLELTLVTGPGGRHYALMHAGRDAAAAQRARAGLREAAASFRGLSAAERAQARPWVVRQMAMPAGGFAELARRSPLGPQAERQLRLINGVYASGVAPATGRPVKVIE
jgi:predicted Zn-dependent protease